MRIMQSTRDTPDQQIQVIGGLTEGMSIRAVERMTGIHRDTIMRLGAKVGRGRAELHERMMVWLRVDRIECDELWAFVGKKQKHLNAQTAAKRAMLTRSSCWLLPAAHSRPITQANATRATRKSSWPICASAF
jgi:hypothetical protein